MIGTQKKKVFLYQLILMMSYLIIRIEKILILLPIIKKFFI